MDHNSYPKGISGRSISPFPTAERRISPEHSSKYIAHYDSKEREHRTFAADGTATYFSDESPVHNHDRNRRRNDEDLPKLSLAEISLELDNNSTIQLEQANEILYLINKRKHLIQLKRRKLREEYSGKGDTKSRSLTKEMLAHDDQDTVRMSWLTSDPESAAKVLQSLARTLPNLDEKRHFQQEKSNEFWSQNKRYENDIDVMLCKLKQIDFNLQKQTNEVAELCRTLDALEDALKELLIRKSDDHLKRAEPLFANKKKTYELLNSKIYQRERIKDEKIEYIRKIRDYLAQLKITREKRIKELYELFSVENEHDSESRIVFFTECAEGLEEVLRIREKSYGLDSQQKELASDLEQIAKAQESLYSELIKKQSDQARAYQSYELIVRQRSKYNLLLSFFDQVGLTEVGSLYSPDAMAKFRSYRELLKSFVEEDKMIKQGLAKTSETSRTFAHILKATESEKERRKELLNLLENCSRLKNEEEQKKEMVRNLTVETAKKAQQKNHIEDELQNVMTDGDLQSYKKVGNALTKCDSQMEKLASTRLNLQMEIQSINREIVAIAGSLKREYEDILRDILPTNFDINLRTSDDIKQIKNYIRKTYKRLGLIPNRDE